MLDLAGGALITSPMIEEDDCASRIVLSRIVGRDFVSIDKTRSERMGWEDYLAGCANRPLGRIGTARRKLPRQRCFSPLMILPL
jgi:hypothetical protein